MDDNNKIILPNGAPGHVLTQDDLVLEQVGKAYDALMPADFDYSHNPSNYEMDAMKFKNPKQVNELKYIIKDILSGDQKAARDERYSYLNFKQIKTAIEWIQNNSFDESLQNLLISQPWRLVYKIKPPTPEEFLTSKYIGAMADSLWLPVKKNFLEFFDPMKPYRNAYLNPSIGSGKEQPIDSPICIGEEDYIEFKKDGYIFAFSMNDDIYIDNKYIKASEFVEKYNGKNNVNFPVSINYINMMIYDIEKTHLFDEAFRLKDYDSLISYFKNIDENIYDEWNIYTQNHHIIPRSEGGSDNKDNLVKLPYYFHLMAHYLRGKEAEQNGNKLSQYKNFKAVCWALNENSIPKNVIEMHEKLQIVIDSLEKRKSLEKQKIWITNGQKSQQIFNFEKIPEGWKQGRTFKSPSNKKWINKDGQNYYVEKEKLNEYLKNGYSIGMFKTEKMKKANHTSYSTKDTKWMNKDGIRKAVKIDEVDIYLKNGWSLGSASNTCKGKHWITKTKGQNHWYTNGIKNIQAKECPEGYRPGRVFNNGYKD